MGRTKDLVLRQRFYNEKLEKLTGISYGSLFRAYKIIGPKMGFTNMRFTVEEEIVVPSGFKVYFRGKKKIFKTDLYDFIHENSEINEEDSTITD